MCSSPADAEADDALWASIWSQWGTCTDFPSQAEYFQFITAASQQYSVNVSARYRLRPD